MLNYREKPEKYLIQTNPEFSTGWGLFLFKRETGTVRIADKYFLMHFKDAIDYRIKNYYKERYEKWTRQ